METIYCQSCGMPLTKPEDYGTEKEGSLNPDYCIWCYKDGAFVQNVSMEGMIDHCLKFLGEFNAACETKFTPAQARAEMLEHFPHLKRWRTAK